MRRIRLSLRSCSYGAVPALLAALLVIAPLGAQARGIIWLPTKGASASPALMHPAVATYRNHAYILSVQESGGDATHVFFTTNETKHWKTSELSAQGPRASYSQEFVALAIDPSTNTLYAAWIYQKDRQHMALGIWTRQGAGAWSGPVEVATAGALVGEPSIVAGGGHVWVAFTASPQSYAGSCDDKYTHAQDVQVVTKTAGGWSTPQNLTSCASGAEAIDFNDPKLAVDEDGKVFLVSRAGSAGGNLWYADTTSGSWSQAVQFTSGVLISDSALSPAQRTLYGIAASRGTAYVAYTTGSKGSAVRLLVRAPGGAITGPTQASSPDKAGCPQFGLSVVARAGRVLVGYIRAFSGNCTIIETTNDYNTAHLVTGTPARLVAINPGLPRTASCGDTALSSDGDLFRLVADCELGAQKEYGRLYYKKEFLDVVGPKSHLAAPRRLTAGSVSLHWTARDPTPGSGIGYFQLRVRTGTGPWRLVARATRARSLTYPVLARHTYTFRLRARDRVNNWGPWVSAGVRT